MPDILPSIPEAGEQSSSNRTIRCSKKHCGCGGRKTGPHLDLIPENARVGDRVKLAGVVAYVADDVVYVWIGGNRVKLTPFQFNVATITE